MCGSFYISIVSWEMHLTLSAIRDSHLEARRLGVSDGSSQVSRAENIWEVASRKIRRRARGCGPPAAAKTATACQLDYGTEIRFE